jgi:hypothetical protein
MRLTLRSEFSKTVHNASNPIGDTRAPQRKAGLTAAIYPASQQEMKAWTGGGVHRQTFR